MSAILSLIGWLAVAALAFAAVSSAVRGARKKSAGPWTAAAVFACAALIALPALGAVAWAPALILAGALAVTAAVITLARKETSGDVLGHVAEGLGLAGGNVRGLGRWLRSQFPSLVSRAAGGAAQDGPVPLEAVAEHVTARSIPPVMQDPALGPATEPGEIAAANIPVPPPYAALAEIIGGFEPEDDLSLRMFMEGHASGSVAIADAWHAFAETALNGVGLSPAYVAGILEAGDSAGEHASLLAQVHKRFHVVYAAVKEWIAAHGPLPHKAREFLTGEEG